MFVPDTVFKDKLPRFEQLLRYDPSKNFGISRAKEKYLILNDKTTYIKALKAHSKFGNIFISRNLELNRDDLMDQINKKFKKAVRPPNTTTNHALYIMLHENFVYD